MNTSAEAYSVTTGLEIAIIGMAGQFPGAKNIDDFWTNLQNGVESISFFPDEEVKDSGINHNLLQDTNYVKAGAILENVETFDASFFGFNPREAAITDPQHRVFLECAWSAIEAAGYNAETYEGLIGVFAGTGLNTYLFNLASGRENLTDFSDFQIAIANDKDFLTTRVSYKLNLKGPSYTVQTACSTSLVAVHLACQSLLSGECDIALAGGVAIALPQKGGYLYQQGGILSPDGHCRAFDAQAQGTVSGNGVGIVVLKRLAEAIADGDSISAVIKGSAINNDGSFKVSYTAPSIDSQAKVIRAAQIMAEIEPDTISYIETHGTGTTLGDPIEITALTQAFRDKTEQKGFCAIGSVKTNIGHLDTAAGIASLIKTVLAVKNKQIPASLHFEQPNPQIDFANSPFYVNSSLAEWKTNGTPRRAGVSSFGIGGTNAHVILEEAPIAESSSASRPWQLLLLSAKTSTSLETATANLVAHLRQNPDLNLADVAYTLDVGRQAFDHRRMVVCQNLDDAVKVLEIADSPRVLTSYQTPSNRPVVFMFSGQGAQYVNMALELYQSEPIFSEQVDYCCQVLKPHLGLDLRSVLYPHEKDTTQELMQTSLAQPALFVIEYALAKLWMAWGVHPQAMIGHSIGEYVAATLAGVFSLEDALGLVATRGRLMQQLPAGEMVAVPLSESEIKPLLGEKLSLAAINGPAMCVVSGDSEAIALLQNQLTEKVVEYRPLHTSHAFHSQMMEPILAPFMQDVAKLNLNPPEIPFVSNVTGTWITATDATDPSYWVKHLRQTVRFATGMAELLQEPERIFLEIGPGKTLSTFAKQQLVGHTQQVVVSSIRHPREQESDIAFLLTSLGRLWLVGVQVNWSQFYSQERRHRIPLPTYPFEHQRYWIDAQKQPDLPKTDLPVLLATSKKPDVADWFYIPSWKRSIALTFKPGEMQIRSTWLVFIDECGLGYQLVKRLEQENQNVIIVKVGLEFSEVSESLTDKYFQRIFTINPHKNQDYNALMEKLDATENIPTNIIHLWNVTPDIYQASSVNQAQDLGFYSLLFLTQALEKYKFNNQVEIVVISNNIQVVTGEELLCPQKATVLGFINVIPQEYRNIRCRNIDIVIPKLFKENKQKLTEYLLLEITKKTSELVIAYRGDHRWVQTFEPLRLDNFNRTTTKFREGGVYLITGGLGDIGLVLAEHLAKTVRAKLILIGRSALPAPDEWEKWLVTHDENDGTSRKIQKLQELEKLGSEVIAIAADVANEQQMQAAIAQGEKRFGQLNGVIHAAGIVAGDSFKSIAQIGKTECELQFQPKVYGTLVLEKILQNRKLDFCVLMSSLSTILGGLEFIAYSAANVFMDAFVYQHNQKNSFSWLCINWDGWLLEEEHQPNISFGGNLTKLAMTPKEGVEAFEKILSWGEVNQVIISTGNLQVRIDQWIKLESSPQKATSQINNSFSLHARPNLPNAYVAPRNETEQALVNIWEELLGIEQVGIYDNFLELGGHSLLGTQVILRVREAFQVNLPLHDLFKEPTVAGLVEQIERIRSIVEQIGDRPAAIMNNREEIEL
ncbi:MULTISPECIES: type I polyketide synthase [Nostoc]|uniref:SDR family oxidoreductase n=2 Tax=Nostoc TaxID=1177 RepID=A0ABR8I391_9NOSO|nr:MULTISPECIES: type I polyketide synthase [Nostoc]MBD2559794.1 SDR family oxidoreductase [Nostoc linckia FACHB-391]MBD2645242.1 SDR family oxidoreductase [Nostoc foliaceum FACHB-393]